MNCGSIDCFHVASGASARSSGEDSSRMGYKSVGKPLAKSKGMGKSTELPSGRIDIDHPNC